MSISSADEHSANSPKEDQDDNDYDEEEQIQRLNSNHEDALSLSMEATRAIAVQALTLTVQDWPEMGQGDDPTVSEAMLWNENNGIEIETENQFFNQFL